MLNRTLYKALCDVFGRDGVRPIRTGQHGEFGKELLTGKDYGKARLAKTGDDPGEEFAVRCPFCNDHTPRLYINHRWGTLDPYTKKRILWAMHCYNEECQSDWENRVALAKMVFDADDRAAVIPDEPERPEDLRPKVVRLPGALQDIAVLAQLQPRHPAVRWCMGRNLDVQELSRRYGVGYCVVSNSPNSLAAQRLVAPFYVRRSGVTTLAGWTSRLLYPEPDQPKWLHSASSTGRIVYGLSEASKYQTLVVVEGPGDKWTVGRPGAAIFGKTLREEKARRISMAVDDDPDRVIVVLLDPEQDRVAKAKRKRHHSEVAAEMLRSMTRTPVVDVRLPLGTDPGSLDRSYLWNYIIREAARQGVRVTPRLAA